MKVPLYVKLMVSYLLVVSLVILPSVVYLRALLSRDEHARASVDMTQELQGICDRLAAATPAQLAGRTELLMAALPTRLTVVDVTGNVIGDTARAVGASENHGGRPEIRAALARGAGTALRYSQTTRQTMLYVAMRFPRAGAARGVARLSRPETTLNTARDQVTVVLRNASAVALSVAVMLSVVAALAASRPLRRIAQGARAFADGDFAANVDAATGDEIGEVAEALAALASQLRSKLLTSGVDRATLQAILDDIPVGVVLYDDKRKPVTVNGAARALCDLAPFAENERGAEIPRLDRQGPAIDRVLRDGFTVEVPLALPWRPGASLVARWLAVFTPDGARQPALVVIDRGEAYAIERLHAALRTLVAHLRAVPRATLDPALAAAIARDAMVADALLPTPEVSAAAIDPVTARALFDAARDDIAPIAAAAGATFELVASEGDMTVADADGRARRALRALMTWALDDPRRASRVDVDAASQARAVRFAVRGSRAAGESAPDVGALVRPLGGDAGVAPNDEGVECWLLLPRA